MRSRATARDEGFILVVVLWGALIIALLANGVLTAGTSNAISVRTRLDRAIMTATADAALNLTILRLLSSRSADWPAMDGTPFQMELEGRAVTVEVQDQAGKVDLNHAPSAVLSRLFVASGVEQEEAAALAARVDVWRTSRGLRPLNDGAANDASVMPADNAGGRRFVTIEELKLVPGMTAQRFERIAPMVTVYSGSAALDPNLASKDVLVALLGFAAVDAEGVIRVRAVAAQQAEDREAVPRRAPTGHAFEIKTRVARVDGTSPGRVSVIRVTGYLSAPIWMYRLN